MEDGICKHCEKPVIRNEAGDKWRHFPSLKEECAPAPKAESKTDEHGRVIPFTAKGA